MSGEREIALNKIYKEVIEMIQEKDKKANKAKITLIQFDHEFTIQYENKSAH